ncbi:MAG: glycosyltransferase family 4 protein [Patescibacteria group bacterium]|jgi:phosphatidylinositol alpha-1,6-mannosyltransferase
MERYSADLIATSIAEESSAMILNRSQLHLLWWLPLTWLRMCWLCIFRKPDVVHTTDAVMAVALYPLSRLCRFPLVTTVHALDVVWRRRLYQLALRRVLPRLAHIISVSKPTVAFLLARGVAHDRVSVIPNGIMPPAQQDSISARKSMSVRYGIPEKAFLLLSVGRLIERKNMSWFIRDVMPLLPERVYVLIAGAGPEEETILRAIRERGISRRVFLAGEISDEERDIAYTGADLFVMPNKTVMGDAEGFGIVAIEAASRGLPVLTTGIEGIAEAIIDGQNGVYFPEQDAPAAARAIQQFLDDPQALKDLSRSAAAFTIEHFSWERLAEKYYKVYKQVLASRA